MKNLLRKFHIGGSQEEGSEGSRTSSGNLKQRLSASEPASSSTGDQKPLSGLSGLWNVARNTLHPPSGGDQSVSQGGSPKYKADADPVSESKTEEDWSSVSRPEVASPVDSSKAQESVADAKDERVTEPSDQALSLEDEEYQVQVAMALSVNYDPEAAQIETAKQISLGSFPTLRNTTAEVVAYQYWNKNILNYDDKIVDGFYDIYGTAPDSAPETMPALVDLQETPVSASVTLEVVLVNRATDLELVNIEQKAVSLAVSCRVGTVGLQKSGLIQRIADLVAGHMGGQVVDADMLLKSWRTKSVELGLSLGSIVLPLGCLQIGLVRHRALLFKVLADTIGIPCKLVKGRHYAGSHEGAMNIIKVDDGREFIIDLMGTPGTLIPSDATGFISSLKTRVTEYSLPPFGKDASGIEGVSEEFVPGAGIDHPNVQKTLPDNMQCQEGKHFERYQSEPSELQGLTNVPARFAAARPGHPFSHSLRRSPSWTEGIGSPAVRDMQVKGVSQYMMDAAKENPKLAQRLHDVLLESGVRAPLDLFTEISPKQLQAQASEDKKSLEEKEEGKLAKGIAVLRKEKSNVDPGLPPGPAHLSYSSSSVGISKDRLQRLNSVEGMGYRRPLEPSHPNTSPNLSPSSPMLTEVVAPQSSSPVSIGAAIQSNVQESLPPEIIKHVPVAAAAAATAAVVASSMVVAATKSDYATDPTLEVPVAAAATATAAVVVATSAVVGRRRDILEALYDLRNEADAEKGPHENSNQRHDEADTGVKGAVDGESAGTPDGEGTGVDSWVEGDRVSDKSTGSVSARSDSVLDDVAEFEIRWEEIVIGERIGLGSYGEVYRGDWHGTEVAVKKFLNQDISGDALEEFRSEVRLMRRMRHPNVVLFMGAVMRAPNLSIVTEFLPRGSLYRLIHRPNNQLDERKRMRMALDVARGMNYLHNSAPIIVHRDLKSPNLLVDRNWVVKVCDFGLSRMKHNTFLSSKSTAGTPEWMAPEVLRNEPSNEKSDVYSFGVILWELATLQQPWFGMNSMQVVGAVGFQYRCLDIPEDMDPLVAEIIRQCWRSDPGARPSFAEIMTALRPLQKPLTANRSSESGKRGNLSKPAQSQEGKASAVPLSDDASEGQDAAAVR